MQPFRSGPGPSYGVGMRLDPRTATTQEDSVNPMVQPPDYYLLMTMQVPDDRPRRRYLAPVRGTGVSLRDRLQLLLRRTTLGPASGDHVLGEGQWRSVRGSYLTR